MNRSNQWLLPVAAFLAAVSSACGGQGSDGTPAQTRTNALSTLDDGQSPKAPTLDDDDKQPPKEPQPDEPEEGPRACETFLVQEGVCRSEREWKEIAIAKCAALGSLVELGFAEVCEKGNFATVKFTCCADNAPEPKPTTK